MNKNNSSRYLKSNEQAKNDRSTHNHNRFGMSVKKKLILSLSLLFVSTPENSLSAMNRLIFLSQKKKGKKTKQIQPQKIQPVDLEQKSFRGNEFGLNEEQKLTFTKLCWGVFNNLYEEAHGCIFEIVWEMMPSLVRKILLDAEENDVRQRAINNDATRPKLQTIIAQHLLDKDMGIEGIRTVLKLNAMNRYNNNQISDKISNNVQNAYIEALSKVQNLKRDGVADNDQRMQFWNEEIAQYENEIQGLIPSLDVYGTIDFNLTLEQITRIYNRFKNIVDDKTTRYTIYNRGIIVPWTYAGGQQGPAFVPYKQDYGKYFAVLMGIIDVLKNEGIGGDLKKSVLSACFGVNVDVSKIEIQLPLFKTYAKKIHGGNINTPLKDVLTAANIDLQPHEQHYQSRILKGNMVSNFNESVCRILYRRGAKFDLNSGQEFLFQMPQLGQNNNNAQNNAQQFLQLDGIQQSNTGLITYMKKGFRALNDIKSIRQFLIDKTDQNIMDKLANAPANIYKDLLDYAITLAYEKYGLRNGDNVVTAEYENYRATNEGHIQTVKHKLFDDNGTIKSEFQAYTSVIEFINKMNNLGVMGMLEMIYCDNDVTDRFIDCEDQCYSGSYWQLPKHFISKYILSAIACDGLKEYTDLAIMLNGVDNKELIKSLRGEDGVLEQNESNMDEDDDDADQEPQALSPQQILYRLWIKHKVIDDAAFFNNAYDFVMSNVYERSKTLFDKLQKFVKRLYITDKNATIVPDIPKDRLAALLHLVYGYNGDNKEWGNLVNIRWGESEADRLYDFYSKLRLQAFVNQGYLMQHVEVSTMYCFDNMWANFISFLNHVNIKKYGPIAQSIDNNNIFLFNMLKEVNVGSIFAIVARTLDYYAGRQDINLPNCKKVIEWIAEQTAQTIRGGTVTEEILNELQDMVGLNRHLDENIMYAAADYIIANNNEEQTSIKTKLEQILFQCYVNVLHLELRKLCFKEHFPQYVANDNVNSVIGEIAQDTEKMKKIWKILEKNQFISLVYIGFSPVKKVLITNLLHLCKDDLQDNFNVKEIANEFKSFIGKQSYLDLYKSLYAINPAAGIDLICDEIANLEKYNGPIFGLKNIISDISKISRVQHTEVETIGAILKIVRAIANLYHDPNTSAGTRRSIEEIAGIQNGQDNNANDIASDSGDSETSYSDESDATEISKALRCRLLYDADVLRGVFADVQVVQNERQLWISPNTPEDIKNISHVNIGGTIYEIQSSDIIKINNAFQHAINNRCRDERICKIVTGYPVDEEQVRGTFLGQDVPGVYRETEDVNVFAKGKAIYTHDKLYDAMTKQSKTLVFMPCLVVRDMNSLSSCFTNGMKIDGKYCHAHGLGNNQQALQYISGLWHLNNNELVLIEDGFEVQSNLYMGGEQIRRRIMMYKPEMLNDARVIRRERDANGRVVYKSVEQELITKIDLGNAIIKQQIVGDVKLAQLHQLLPRTNLQSIDDYSNYINNNLQHQLNFIRNDNTIREYITYRNITKVDPNNLGPNNITKIYKSTGRINPQRLTYEEITDNNQIQQILRQQKKSTIYDTFQAPNQSGLSWRRDGDNRYEIKEYGVTRDKMYITNGEIKQQQYIDCTKLLRLLIGQENQNNNNQNQQQ